MVPYRCRGIWKMGLWVMMFRGYFQGGGCRVWKDKDEGEKTISMYVIIMCRHKAGRDRRRRKV